MHGQPNIKTAIMSAVGSSFFLFLNTGKAFVVTHTLNCFYCCLSELYVLKSETNGKSYIVI